MKKRITVSLDELALKELDFICSAEERNRSNAINKFLKDLNIKRRKK